MAKLEAAIFIKGSYGPENLGDDVLMTVLARMAVQAAAPEEVAVGVAWPEAVRSWYPPARYVHLNDFSEVRVRDLVLGGGGQFYSFGPDRKPPMGGLALGDRLGRLLQGKIGARQVRRRVRMLFSGATEVTADRMAAFGVGVGPFQEGSCQIEAARETLGRCSLLIVRDRMSLNICNEWGLSRALLRTDAAFLSELWLEPEPKPGPPPARNRVGVIVRAWPHDEAGAAYLAPVREAARRLRSEGLAVTFISFAKAADKELLKAWSSEEWIIYDPSRQSPSRFIRELAGSFDVVLSARAHGIILPALAGVPGICVGLEPKLANVHQMLPRGTRLWGPPFSEPGLAALVRELLEHGREARNNLDGEVKANQDLARQAQRELEAFLGEETK
jgi:polysaccharide pyruvyl transferase WcaK-like protein